MSIEAMQLALEALQCAVPKDAEQFRLRGGAITALREAIQQVKAQQPATAIACGITGMAKTTCPFCEQSFAFEHEQPSRGEPVGEVFYAADGGDDETGAGYYMKPCPLVW